MLHIDCIHFNNILIMKRIIYILLLLLVASPMWGQVDRKEVRRGNREFRKGEYKIALEEDYKFGPYGDALLIV